MGLRWSGRVQNLCVWEFKVEQMVDGGGGGGSGGGGSGSSDELPWFLFFMCQVEDIKCR